MGFSRKPSDSGALGQLACISPQYLVERDNAGADCMEAEWKQNQHSSISTLLR